MKLKNVKKVIELLLVKKHNFIIQKDELEFLNELQFLLDVANNKISNKKEECECVIDYETIDKETELNQCLDCGLPLAIF